MTMHVGDKTARTLRGALAAAVLFTAIAVLGLARPAAPAQAAAAAPAWLARVNEIRTAAGVRVVSADSGAVTGLRQHLIYLAKTPQSQQSGQYASAHTENPASKYYTAAGAREASQSDLTFGSSSDLDAINTWLSAPFHAIGMLRSGLTEVGFYRDPATGYAGLDVIGHLGAGTTQPVLYPRGTLGLSRFNGGEEPDPVETCRHAHPGSNWQAAGFPLIAMLPQLTSTAGISATLTEPNGQAISTTGTDLCLVDASTYYSSDAIYGPTGGEILQGDNAVLLIPRHPVTAGKYTVRLQLGGLYPGSLPAWTFTSAPTASTPTLDLAGTTCSRKKHPSGSVSLYLYNPADDAGRATYRVGTGRQTITRSVADGASTTIRIRKLAAGRHTFTLTGSDHTHARLSTRVRRCG